MQLKRRRDAEVHLKAKELKVVRKAENVQIVLNLNLSRKNLQIQEKITIKRTLIS